MPPTAGDHGTSQPAQALNLHTQVRRSDERRAGQNDEVNPLLAMDSDDLYMERALAIEICHIYLVEILKRTTAY